VPPEDARALTRAIRALAADQTQRHELGRAGRCYAEQELDVKTILRNFIERAALTEFLSRARSSQA